MKKYNVQPLDIDKLHSITFNRSELKRLFNNLLLSERDSLPVEQLLQKLKYYIEADGKS